MERDPSELSDAYNSLGINPIINKEIEGDGATINIYLGGVHQESLPLARAVHICKSIYKERINIIMASLENQGLYIFDGVDFHTCKYPKKFDYSLIPKHRKSICSGDAFGFEEYSENKYLAGVILRMNGIRVPKELVFRKRHNKSGNNENKLRELPDIIGEEKGIVLKPSYESCGRGVHILKSEDIDENFYNKYLKDQNTVLIQEKIESYPIVIDSIKKDWNLRVLVTFDSEKVEYSVAGIIGRIDNDGVPVNISITADYISLDEIRKLTGWSQEQYEKLKKDIDEIATKSVTALVHRISKNNSQEYALVNHQDIAGVDIIVNKNLEPVVIEVNPSNSCGIYQLMKFKGIEAVFPIAKSILTKTMLVSRIFEYKNDNTTIERKNEIKDILGLE